MTINKDSFDWVNVKERLPDKTCKVIIKGYVDALQTEEFLEVSTFKKRKIEGYFSTCFDWKQATHWMLFEGSLFDVPYVIADFKNDPPFPEEGIEVELPG